MLRGDYCYYYSAEVDDRRGWVEANSYCMENGAYLASVHGQDENDFITDIVSSEKYNCTQDLYCVWEGT